MEKVLKDEKFQRLLKNKQKLELFSLLVPFVGIFALMIFLYFFTKEMLLISMITLGFILILVIAQYIFDSYVSRKVDETYLELTKYFQDEIVPRLLKQDNKTLEFDSEKDIDISVVEAIDLFNRYKKYHSRFHYDAQVGSKKIVFDEVLFDELVDYNTTGLKEEDERINTDLNYHVYQFETDHNYETEALFVLNGFEELMVEDIITYSRVDLRTKSFGIKDDIEFSFFTKEQKKQSKFMKEKIFQLFREEQIKYHSMAIHINCHKVSVFIEEFENLINPPRSKKFTVEKLMFEYRQEQLLVRKIMQAFEL